MNRKLFLPLILFVALIVAFFVQLQRNGQGDDPKALESALVGQAVPTMQLTDLFSNQPVKQAIFQQGKPILLNVWATWCPTCYAEHQYLNQLAEQGVVIIGVDYKDQREKAVSWLQRLNNPYQQVLFDEKGSFGLDLGVYGAPETFVIDGNGIIQYRHAGDLNEKVWQEKIQPIYQRLISQHSAEQKQ
ncbi:DsbE family thiol:disulfide interchange protein [Lonepinella sp. BR2474]|uniref:DsbE family thiol:disulfide interchange protein n=1 Tax=Lonepinella sp. BR2474 TaxID=3434548 RepID=UPI003F6E3A43